MPKCSRQLRPHGSLLIGPIPVHTIQMQEGSKRDLPSPFPGGRMALTGEQRVLWAGGWSALNGKCKCPPEGARYQKRARWGGMGSRISRRG